MAGGLISPRVAPGNPYLGVMLPYSPLHHLLMRDLACPVVATSGNVADEPICIDEREALKRLGGMADLFLVHDRPIARHVDDSIVRLLGGREMVLRRARGYAPLPVSIARPDLALANGPEAPCVLGVGAHLKNTVALSVGTEVFISQHIGDLETEEAFQAFQKVIGDLQQMHGRTPEVIAADVHPDYLSTKYGLEIARRTSAGRPAAAKFVKVQHHLAHVLGCMVENEVTPPLLGVSWDGTGQGLDGTIWGGEFFIVTPRSWERVAHFRRFPLPGGDKAIREPRRAAPGPVVRNAGGAISEGGCFAGGRLFVQGTGGSVFDARPQSE